MNKYWRTNFITVGIQPDWSWPFATFSRGGVLWGKLGWVYFKFHYIDKPNLNRLVPYSIRYYRMQKELIEHDAHSHAVCSDPMNGCPGDFAESFSRQATQMEWKIYAIEHKVNKWLKRWADYKLGKVYEREQDAIDQLPWHQEHEVWQ